jgi:hypothetical protein
MRTIVVPKGGFKPGPTAPSSKTNAVVKAALHGYPAPSFGSSKVLGFHAKARAVCPARWKLSEQTEPTKSRINIALCGLQYPIGSFIELSC